MQFLNVSKMESTLDCQNQGGHRIVFVGSGSCGKTRIISALMNHVQNQNTHDPLPTIGVDITIKNMDRLGRVHVWELSGSSQFGKLLNGIIDNTTSVGVVIWSPPSTHTRRNGGITDSITQNQSLIKTLKENGIPIIHCMSKCDESTDEDRIFADENGMIKVSAETEEGIDILKHDIYQHCIQKSKTDHANNSTCNNNANDDETEACCVLLFSCCCC